MVMPSAADAHDVEGFGVPWQSQVQLMLMMLGVLCGGFWGAMVKPSPADAHDAGGLGVPW